MPASAAAIFDTLSASLRTLTSTPSAHQTIGVNSGGTAWALRTPGWLDTAQTWTQTQTFAAASFSGNVGVGTTSPASALDLFGSATQTFSANSSTSTKRTQADLVASWSTSTDASRKGRIVGNIYDTASRQWLQVDTDGSVPLVGLAPSIGRVGVGTASPGMLLDVGGYGSQTTLGGGTPSHVIGVKGDNNGTTGVQMYNANGGTIADFRFSVLNNNRNQYLSFYNGSDANTATILGQVSNTTNYIFNNTLSGGTDRNLTIGTVASTALILGTANAERMRITSVGNFGINTASQFGSGTLVIGIANCTAAPSTNPSGGGVLYAESGALKWRGSSGTVTTIANA